MNSEETKVQAVEAPSTESDESGDSIQRHKHDHRHKGKKDKKYSPPAAAENHSNGDTHLQPLGKHFYEKELARLQFELVKMQYWIQQTGMRLVLVFEGRDAAGKGGVIQRMVEPLNPRGVRQVALAKPSDVERTQWYFQRYVAHLPSAGEIVIFDRSWYNRAGVERVMGFCSDQEYWEFLRSCPEFERMLVRSGIILVKYYLSVSDAEQERRFQSRAKDPTRRWKLSDMDLETRKRWVQFSKVKDMMLQYTDIPEARWYQIESNDKERARLNCIHHLVSHIDYEDMIPKAMELPPRPPADEHYVRPPRSLHIVVPDYYADRD
jgi:polyphosphate kinase 2